MKFIASEGKRDCLILSVGEFDNRQKNRDNFEIDAKKLFETFTNLSFNCRVRSGYITLVDAQKEIREILYDQNGKDMICLCLLSHGIHTCYGQQIEFSDEKQVTLEKLAQVISNCSKII